MVDLNLLPGDLKRIQKKRAGIKIKMPKIVPAPLIILLISVLLLSQGSIGLLAVTQRNRLIKLNAEFGKISAQEKMALALKKEADELNRRLTIIESLTSGSLLWSKKLYDLSGAVIDGAWLTSLSLSTEELAAKGARRQAMVLRGSAVSPAPGGETAIVGKFIESLKENKGFFSDFEDIKVSSIQRKRLGEIEVMDFTIVCYFKPGRSYFEKLKA